MSKVLSFVVSMFGIYFIAIVFPQVAYKLYRHELGDDTKIKTFPVICTFQLHTEMLGHWILALIEYMGITIGLGILGIMMIMKFKATFLQIGLCLSPILIYLINTAIYVFNILKLKGTSTVNTILLMIIFYPYYLFKMVVSMFGGVG